MLFLDACFGWKSYFILGLFKYLIYKTFGRFLETVSFFYHTNKRSTSQVISLDYSKCKGVNRHKKKNT